MRPPPPLAFAVALGVAGGAVEVALRASPRQGLEPVAIATWLAASIGLSALACVGAAFVGWLAGRRPHGVVLAIYAGMHAAINYRFELVLNEFVRDPRVWGGMLAILGTVGVLALSTDAALRARRLPRGLLLVALIASGLAFVRATPPAGKPGSAPSILVITLDTTRPDRLSPYGREIATPALQRLADEGVLFEEAIANAPITEPSHLAMFTGDPPLRTGVMSNGTELGDRPGLLWHALRAKGWLTAGFVAGFPLHSKYGWDQGMDVYDDDFGRLAGLQSLSIVKSWNQVAVKEHALRERPADDVLARAAPWLRAHRDEQFFLWVHFYDAHGPYESKYNAELGAPPMAPAPQPKLPAWWPEAMRRVQSNAWLAAAYEGELRVLDDAVAVLLDALGPALDRTVITVLADHGESMGEHDYWFDHGDDLYDPSLRIPWIVRYPGGAAAGTRVKCQVGAVDLAPTLLELAGVDDGIGREGVSRAAELGGAPCKEDPVFASTVSGRMVADPPVDHAFRGRGVKFVLPEGRPVELYHLATDPRELVNLAPNTLSGQLETVLGNRVEASSRTEASADAATLQMLIELGYAEP